MKTKTAILFTLLFLAGIQVSFGQSHLARRALAAPPPKDNSITENKTAAKNQNTKIGNTEYVYVEAFSNSYNPMYISYVINYKDFNFRKSEVTIAAKKKLKSIPNLTHFLVIDFHKKEDAEESRQLEIQKGKGAYEVKEFTIDAPTQSKNDNSTTNNQPYYGYFEYKYGVEGADANHWTCYYSQVVTVPYKLDKNGERTIDWDAERALEDSFRKILDNNGIPSIYRIDFNAIVDPDSDPSNENEGKCYTSKGEAEQGRQKQMQWRKNGEFGGYQVKELIIDVPNKTKLSKSLQGKQNKK